MSRKNQFIKVHPQSFDNLMKAVKKFEKTNPAIKVKNMKLSKFLVEVSDYQNSTATIAYQVKRAILLVYGDRDTDPLTVDDNINMSTYGFSDPENYNDLTASFNKIAKGNNASARKLLRKEVRACAKVKNCVELVRKVSDVSPTKVNVK